MLTIGDYNINIFNNITFKIELVCLNTYRFLHKFTLFFKDNVLIVMIKRMYIFIVLSSTNYC